MKKCLKCPETRLEMFGKDKNKKDGLKIYCKKCHNDANTISRNANPEVHRKTNLAYARSPEGRSKQRANSLRRKFWPHMTNEQAEIEYSRILTEQGGHCALCPRTKTTIGTNLHVDHCKQSGIVRGLLCDICNRIVVQDKTPGIVKKLYDYFKKYHILD